MPTYTVTHLLAPLLQQGVIEAARKPTLFDTLLEKRAEVETHLAALGMELVVLTDVGIAHARLVDDHVRDAMAEKDECEPIPRISHHKRLSFYDSAAVIHFRQLLEQELMQGGDEIWQAEPDVFEALAATYAPNVAQDRVALDERIRTTLANLEKLGLIACRAKASPPTYRGRALLRAAFSRSQIAAFAERMTALADAASQTPDEASDEVFGDTCASEATPGATTKETGSDRGGALVDLDPDLAGARAD